MIKICSVCHHHFLATESKCQHCSQPVLKATKNPMLAIILGLGIACGDKDDTADSEPTPLYGDPAIDEDQDGFFLPEDCNDNDVNTYPGAAELDSTTECMTDADNDGYGDMNASSPVVAGTDCNDDDENAYPDAEEIPDDGVDNNCDGEIDEFIGDLYGVPE